MNISMLIKPALLTITFTLSSVVNATTLLDNPKSHVKHLCVTPENLGHPHLTYMFLPQVKTLHIKPSYKATENVEVNHMMIESLKQESIENINSGIKQYLQDLLTIDIVIPKLTF